MEKEEGNRRETWDRMTKTRREEEGRKCRMQCERCVERIEEEERDKKGEKEREKEREREEDEGNHSIIPFTRCSLHGGDERATECEK